MKQRMKPEVKAQFVEALRSGRFCKGPRGRLKDPFPSFCAAGVLCELAADAGVVRREAAHYREIGVMVDTSWIYIPPPSVLEWAGYTGEYAEPTCSPVVTKLIAMNDGDGASFEEIAKVVEKEF